MSKYEGRKILGPPEVDYEYMDRLRVLMNRCKKRYYLETDLPGILSDHEYDMMERCLKDYEAHYPEYTPEDSPTKIVGAYVEPDE